MHMYVQYACWVSDEVLKGWPIRCRRWRLQIEDRCSGIRQFGVKGNTFSRQREIPDDFFFLRFFFDKRKKTSAVCPTLEFGIKNVTCPWGAIATLGSSRKSYVGRRGTPTGSMSPLSARIRTKAKHQNNENKCTLGPIHVYPRRSCTTAQLRGVSRAAMAGCCR